MVLSVTWDLSVRASGRVANIAHEAEGRVGYFSNETASEYRQIPCCTKKPCFNCFVIGTFAALSYVVCSLIHEYSYCIPAENPTSMKPVTVFINLVFINLVFLAHLQVDPQHSCGLFKETTDRGTIRMYHSELASHLLSMGFSRATISMSHCG